MFSRVSLVRPRDSGNPCHENCQTLDSKSSSWSKRYSRQLSGLESTSGVETIISRDLEAQLEPPPNIIVVKSEIVLS